VFELDADGNPTGFVYEDTGPLWLCGGMAEPSPALRELTNPPRRDPVRDPYYQFTSLAGTLDAFDPRQAKPWLIGDDPGPWQGLWRTEDGRWVLDDDADGEKADADVLMREVTARTAAWMLTTNRYALPPGLTPVLADPDGTEGVEKTPASEPSLTQSCLDPVEKAIELIGGSPQAVKLIRFLNQRTDRTASLDDIAIGLDRARPASLHHRRGTIRQRFNRARKLLEERGAPITLMIENKIIELVIVQSG
jgi:hypothetical protein